MSKLDFNPTIERVTRTTVMVDIEFEKKISPAWDKALKDAIYYKIIAEATVDPICHTTIFSLDHEAFKNVIYNGGCVMCPCGNLNHKLIEVLYRNR